MRRILVVDEEPGNRLILQSRFGEQGFEVVPAETGASGLVEARNQKFDLYLVSAGLRKGIGSTEVCRRLQANPATASVPLVVFQNSAADPEQLDAAYEAGADAYVPKAEMSGLDHAVRVLLGFRAAQEALVEERRSLEERVRRLEALEAQPSERDGGQRDSHEHAQVLRELSSGRPDGLLVVDSEGYVRQADRGARSIFGSRLEGGKLGSLAPASGLEAFVRDAHTEPREGFRFELAVRAGRPPRSFRAAVVPLVANPGQEDPDLKVVILRDAHKLRLAADLLRFDEAGLQRSQAGPLIEAARVVYGPGAWLGDSPESAHLREELPVLVESREPVLVVGEPGCGKERLARTLHFSGLAAGGFVQVSCSSLSAESLEDELFGCVAGASADVAADRAGLVHLADEGTLYVERIDELPEPLQAKLLELLTEGRFVRRGGSRKERAEVRLVVSSPRPLDGAVAEGRLRRDLYEALSTQTIELPPLRERLGDVPAIAQGLVRRFGAARGVEELSPAVSAVLEQYDWPSNVAELEDVIRHACARAEGALVELADLPPVLQELAEDLPAHELVPAAPGSGADRPGTHSVVGEGGGKKLGWVAKEIRPFDITDDEPVSLELYEKKALLRALYEVDGDKLAAARLLKVGKSTLYRKLKRFDIS